MSNQSSNRLSRFWQSDSSRFSRPDKPILPKFWGFILFILILIFGAILAGLITFNRGPNDQKNKIVSVQVIGPNEAVTTEEVGYQLKIKNGESQNLKNLELTVNFPEGFNLISSQPDCSQKLTQGCIWLIDELKEKGEERVELKGSFLGEAEKEKSFSGRLNFQLSNLSATYQKEFSQSIVLKPVLDLEVESPAELTIGQESDLKIKVKNLGQKNLGQIKAIVVYPQWFILTKTEPSLKSQDLPASPASPASPAGGPSGGPSGGSSGGPDGTGSTGLLSKSFLIDDFKENQIQEINFRGYFSSSQDLVANFKFQAGLINQENDQFFLQTEKIQTISLREPSLSLGIKLNNSDRDSNLDWGDFLNISLNYKNTGQEEIRDLKLKLRLSGSQYLEVSRLKDLAWQWQSSENFLQSNNWQTEIGQDSSEEYFIWQDLQVPVLTLIKSGEEGNLELKFKIKPLKDALKENFTQAEISGELAAEGRTGSSSGIFQIKSQSVKVRIKTELSFKTAARYYDDESFAIGQGPLPPVVNQETYYWVFWSLYNTTNTLKDISVKTQLPAGVNFSGKSKTSVGQLNFDQNEKKVTWQIDQLPAYQGGPYSLVEAGFEIVIKPDQNQVGQILSLTRTSFLEAFDEFAKDSISQQAEPVDANLVGDPRGAGKGVVQP